MNDYSKSQMIMVMKGVEKIAMLTAYDYSIAALESANKVDMILVGDSANFILNGRDTTRGITMDQMVEMAERVANGVKKEGDDYSLVVGDLPAGSYDTIESAVANATKLWDAGVDAVKLEGGTEKPYLSDTIKAIINQGIPVQGHIGYTPQSETLADKGVVQGKTEKSIEKLFADYELLAQAGVFSVVLECIPWQVSELLTKRATIPTVGIGAGPYCDGQVLVSYDLLGLSTGLPGKPGKFPKFVWQYDMKAPEAIRQYVADVKSGKMPDLEHSYSLADVGVLEKFKED